MDKAELKKRMVGLESQKTYQKYIDNGFFERFMSGSGLEIGGKGANGNTVPILPDGTLVDLDYPGYDGLTLPFADNSQSWVYSSHCLEHVEDYKAIIRDWHRVTKVGGHIVTVIPLRDLYEKKLSPPSLHNGGHHRFYTLGRLLAEFEESLPPNSFRVRLAEDNDEAHDYSIKPGTHSNACYEGVLVIEKIEQPSWKME